MDDFITDFKNMADYHEERTLKASGKGENEDKNDCHKTTRDSWEEINAGKRQKRLWIETQNKFYNIIFNFVEFVFILTFCFYFNFVVYLQS